MSSGELAGARDGRVQESVPGVPAPALRPFVAWYSGYRQAGVPPATHRGLPSPYLTLIITLDDPLDLAVPTDPGRPPGRYRTLLGGLHTRPAIIRHDGRQSGIQLGLRPLGARMLLGLPAGELHGIDTEAADVLGPVAVELHERVQATPTWAGRFAVVDKVLLRQLREDPPVSGEVRRAWRALPASGGLAAVPELAGEAGWSSRRLSTRFRTELGLAPKEAARVVRFDRARRLLQPGRFSAYVVTGDPDGLFARATAAGAKVIMELHDTDYGSRDFAVHDPEGNRWSFGTYRGEPRKS